LDIAIDSIGVPCTGGSQAQRTSLMRPGVARQQAHHGVGQALVRLERRRREAAAACRRGASETRVCAWQTALDTPSTTGTGMRSLIERASPASGAPAMMITSAPSSSTADRQSACRRSAWSSCTRPMSRNGLSRLRMLASRSSKPFAWTHSRYHAGDAARDRDDRESLPSRQALISAASVMPDHRDVQRLAQPGDAGIAEGGDDDGVVPSPVLGGERRGGVGADQRLEARLDVGHAERRGQHAHVVPGAARAARLGRDQVGDALRGVGIDQQMFMAMPRRALSARRRGSSWAGGGRNCPRPARGWKSLPSHTTSPRQRQRGQAFTSMPSYGV
jgi:hypothetical protein